MSYDSRAQIKFTAKAKYKSSSKATAIDGVLMMRCDGFNWSPNDPHAAVRLEVEFTKVKSYRWSKETSTATSALLKFGTHPDPAAEGGYIFVFANFKDRDTCKDFYGAYQAKHQVPGKPNTADTAAVPPPAKSPAPQAAKPSPEERIDLKEFQKRQKLLQTDASLRKLHQELVMGNILKEEEFWSTRKELLEGEEHRRKRQRTGIATAMLADVRPVTDGQSNTVTFSLTPEIIAQIFAEKPVVLQNFIQFVPSKMNEKEFWTKYCRAEYLLSTHKSAAAFAEAADDEDLAMFVREDTNLAEEAKNKIRRVDPTVDMASDEADDYSEIAGHGILRGGTKSTAGDGAGRTKRTIVRDINRHAAVVLQGKCLDSDTGDARSVALAMAKQQQESANSDQRFEMDKNREDRVCQSIDLDDLHGPSNVQYLPLNIEDPRKYFTSQSKASDSGLSKNQAMGASPLEVVAMFRKKLNQARSASSSVKVVEPAAALKVLIDINKKLFVSRQVEGSMAEKAALVSLPETLRPQLFSYAEAVRELLRHFWAAYPITSKVMFEKAERHKKGIDSLYDKLEKFKKGCPQEQRHLLSQLLKPMIQGLDSAIHHFDDDAKRRSQRTAALGQK